MTKLKFDEIRLDLEKDGYKITYLRKGDELIIKKSAYLLRTGDSLTLSGFDGELILCLTGGRDEVRP